MHAPYDITIVGGGIVGLATAYRLLERRPGLRLAMLEKEPEIALHQSGHNTGVIHAGIYYRPGSLRARLCREGKAALERFADEHGIRFKRCGKLIVALGTAELPRLAALLERGTANGVEGLVEIGPERIREIEPHVAGIRALYSPGTGVIDFRQIAMALADEVRGRGGEIQTRCRVVAIAERGQLRVLSLRRSSSPDAGAASVDDSADWITCRAVISCAGLHSDRVAAMTGHAGDVRIVPFRGDYYRFTPEARHLVRALINPVPDPALPFLGIHFTRRIDDEILAGPNAVLAFAREAYRFSQFSARDLGETLIFPGFLRLLGRHFREALSELWCDVSKAAFLARLRRYLPELQGAHLIAGPSGVRAQALDREGNLLDDFSFGEGSRVLHVRNAPSPAATASLAIGSHLAALAEERFGPV